MINTIFVVFVLGFLFQKFLKKTPTALWILISLFVFLQGPQSTLWAVIGLLIIQEVVFQIARRIPRDLRFLPLIYCAVLLTIHHSQKLNITGLSYILLASSIDLWLRLKSKPLTFKERFVNLVSFPKALVGPITAATEHFAPPPESSRISFVALKGIIKGLILVNLWRTYVPAPLWIDLNTPLDYFWFGLWNYIHLYLEFSGACDLVAATFWIFGFGCPINFDRPYMALSITEFWKRWHITLGLWIRNYVFIPLGGSRVAQPLIYLNLLIAMTLSGAWHGITFSFIAWGLLQGIFLCLERLLNWEQKLHSGSQHFRMASWLMTQFLVTLSWILFFS